MDDVYFSIIIPIYNVEKYLHQCVESVLNQSFKNIEVILVDDGSPDGSPQICDDFASKDNRVKVVHKKNGGLSDARNHGIETATGEYLLFLDGDDYWGDTQALAKTYTEINQYDSSADIVMFQAQLLYEDVTVIKNNDCIAENFNNLGKEEALNYLLENGYLIGSACSKVVKRKFLLENNLFFKVGIKSEDIHWILRVANAMPKYQYTDQYFYMYRKGRVGSITTTVGYEHLCQLADIIEEFSIDYKFSNKTAEKCILSLVAYQLTILMANIANLQDRNERNNLKKRIKIMAPLLNYDMHPRVRLVNKVKNLIGFKGAMYMLGIYLKYRGR